MGRARRGSAKAGGLIVCTAALLLLAACSLPGNAAPVLKLGVIAPFEGRGRALGYAVLPEIKAAAAEANTSGELGAYRVLVVAFNDNLDPDAARDQARALALDGDVFGVVGPFTPDASAAAEPVLTAAGLPAAPVNASHFTGTDFSTEQRAAKEAARSLLQALAAQIHATGHPQRPALSTR